MTPGYWNRNRVPRVPQVWWEVQARKWLCTEYSEAIRNMWGCGNYARHF